jgi:beta-lactam-binding protein with PASTA domain
VNEVQVPKVIGKHSSEAQAVLQAAPLTTEVVTRPAQFGEKVGVVVAQFPASGTLSQYDTVRIVVSKATHGTVPRLVGLDVDQARKLLARRGYVPRIELVPGDADVVLSQTPKSGTAGKRDLVVTLRVGRG